MHTRTKIPLKIKRAQTWHTDRLYGRTGHAGIQHKPNRWAKAGDTGMAGIRIQYVACLTKPFFDVALCYCPRPVRHFFLLLYYQCQPFLPFAMFGFGYVWILYRPRARACNQVPHSTHSKNVSGKVLHTYDLVYIYIKKVQYIKHIAHIYTYV